MTQAGGKWFHRYGAAADPALRLVCFPHAGGVPTFFHDWAAHLPDGIELLAACYPGRQSRYGETPVPSLEALADDAVEALGVFLGVPVAFFGHSMGAALAYEVARRLDARHGVRPVRLFLSGQSAPHRREPSRFHLEDDATLVAAVRELGLSSADAMSDPELLALTLPALRADFQAIETYDPEPAKVRCPIVAYSGDQDRDCPPEDVRAWAALTTGRFEYRAFPGGHFYLEPQAPALLRHLVGHLRDDLRFARAVRTAGGQAPAAGARAPRGGA